MMRLVRKKKSLEPHGAKLPPQPPVEPPPEIVKELEEEFPEEDSASRREHFERIIDAPPQRVYEVFVSYVWRENAAVTSVEIVKDGKDPKELEPGMIRRIVGHEEEITMVKKNKMVESKVLEGMPTSYQKARILFKPEADGTKTRVIWTIWWTPTSYAAGIAYTVMMKGFCNVSLYRLDQAVMTGVLEEAPVDEPASDEPAHSSSSGDFPLIDSALADGEVPKLQWAARLQTGYEGNLTEDQQQGLNELRESLQKTDPEAWALCQKHPDGPDRMMLRFLRAECSGRARKFNVEKSKKRLVETLRFRRDMKADELITKDPPHLKEFIDVGGELVILDREGRVVIFTRAGLLSQCLDTKLMAEDEWRRNLVCVSERRMQMLRESSKRLGHEVSATVIVYDLRGMGFNSRKIIPFTKMINEDPELVDMIFVTFAPSLFTALFTTVKGFLDPITASKVSVFGTSKHEVQKMKASLRAIVDPRVLPKEFGGENLVNQVGYPMNYKGEKFPYE